MRSWLALGMFVLVGCGSNGIELEDAPDEVRGQYCKYLAHCGMVENASACEQLNLGADFHIDASLAAAIDAGKVHYDGGKLADCYDRFASLSCDGTSENARSGEPASCAEAIKGTVGAGGTCAIDAECLSSACDVPDCPDACCQGSCVGDAPPPTNVALGGTCKNNRDCARGFCDLTSHCVALKTSGATCAGASECDYGLGCVGTPRVCKPLPTIGQPCPDGACRDTGTYCNAAMTCANYGLPGDACLTRNDCSPLYICDPTNKCALGPHAGQTCSNVLRCSDAGTFCDAATMICKSAQPDGVACAANTQCTSHFCSNDPVRVCAPEPVCF